MRNRPIVYLPFGTLNGIAPHMTLGNDTVKAYEIRLRAAEKTGDSELYFKLLIEKVDLSLFLIVCIILILSLFSLRFNASSTL